MQYTFRFSSELDFRSVFIGETWIGAGDHTKTRENGPLARGGLNPQGGSLD